MSYQPIDTQSLFQQALEQYNNKDYAASLPYCQQIIEQIPRDFNALQLTGINYYQLGKVADAIEWLEKALQVDATKPQLFNSLACAYRDSGKLEQAITAFQRALDLSPGYTNALRNLAELYIKLDRINEAIPLLNLAYESSPDNKEIRLKLGECYSLTERHEEAIAILSQLLEDEPVYPGAQITLANALLRTGNFQQAEDIYRQQIADDETNAGAWNNLGALFEKQEQWSQAKDCFVHATELNPALASAHANLAHTWLMLDEAELSIQYGIRALASEPHIESVSLTLSAASKVLGDAKAAEAYLMHELERDNRFSPGWYHLGNLYRETGRFEEAIECYENTLLIDPEHANAELNLGLALLTLGRFGKGFRHYFKRPRILTANATLSPITPGQQFTGKRILLLRAQGIGDELLFLRFAQQLKDQGAWIAYQGNKKLVPLLQGIDSLDLVIDESETPPVCDFTFAIDDLPLVLNIQTPDQIPSSLKLKTQTSIENKVSTYLRTTLSGPYIAINWRAGTENRSDNDYNPLSKSIPIREFATMIEHIDGTFVVVQRNIKDEELQYLENRFPNRIIDMTSLNDDLEEMLALLNVIDDYIGVSNTDMHLLASIGKRAKVLVTFPPEWRWMNTDNESPWMPGFTVHRQDLNGDWPELEKTTDRSMTSVHPDNKEATMNKALKLEFGCGESQPKEGFVGVDIREHPHVQYVCSAWEITEHVAENSVSEIYSRHFFEHLSFTQAEKTIRAWNSILKPGGKIEMLVPNMAYHIQQWLDPDRKTKLLPGNSGLTYEEHAKRGFWGHQREGFEKTWDLHKSGYDWPLLRDFLDEHGFIDIVEIVGMPKNLHVIAIKP